MGKSVFCEELEGADNAFAAQGEQEDREKSIKELERAIRYFAKNHSVRKIFGKNRRLKKANRALKKENKCLRKENKRLTEENEVLREQTLRGMGERGKTPATVKSIRRVDSATVEGSDHIAAGDNLACSNGNQKRTFVSKIGEVFLEALPKLLNIAVKAIMVSFIDHFHVWFGKRAGELCT